MMIAITTGWLLSCLKADLGRRGGIDYLEYVYFTDRLDKGPNPRFNVFSQAKDIVKQNKLKAEEKQAKERRRILSLGKTDSNSLVADRVE